MKTTEQYRKRKDSLILCGAAIAFWAAFAESATLGQQAEPRVFETFEVAALALGLEIPLWVRELEPPPSQALREIVAARPALIVVEAAGKSWRVRPVGAKIAQAVDTAKYPLSWEDLQTAERLLAQPYLGRWIECLREAVLGKGDKPCVLGLAEDAQRLRAVDQQTAELLLANLGAKVLALSNHNAQWAELVYAKVVPAPIEDALQSFRRLEADKIKVAFAAAEGRHVESGLPISLVSSGVGSSGGKVGWNDFQDSPAFQRHTQQGPVTRQVSGWTINADGKVRHVGLGKEVTQAGLVTFALSTEHQMIIKGNISAREIEQIKSAATLPELLDVTKRFGGHVFLSRPGDAQLGVVERLPGT